MRDPHLVPQDGFSVVGIEARTSNRLESDLATARIPGLWKRLFEERVAERIPNAADPGVIYAAYTKYESDYRGQYSLIVGCRVSQSGAVPSGMVSATIPAANYLVFTAAGQMPRALIETWEGIWKYFSSAQQYQRAYTADFELHRLSAPDTVEVYIAVS